MASATASSAPPSSDGIASASAGHSSSSSRRWPSGWEDGRRRRKSVYAPTRAEVATKLTKLLHDDDEGLPATSDQLTLWRFIRE